MHDFRSSGLLKVPGFWILFIFLLFIVGRFIKPAFPASWEQFVYGIGGTIGTFLLLWGFIKAEKGTFRNYELFWQSGTLPRFFKGFLFGAIIFSCIMLVLVAAGGIRIRFSNSWDTSAAFWYLSIIPLALFEELAFRSYPFILLNKKFSFLITQLIVAVAFAVYHMIMGWDTTVAILGPGIWALVFGLGAAWSKGIALPTGIHVALNLSQHVVGMKEDNGGNIFIMQELPSAAFIPANTVGMICQVAVGVLALILTVIYRDRLK